MSSDWFYHAPQKRQTRAEQPLMPPMSQVPGLSDLPSDSVPENKPPGVLIRDTDSKYIRLAKMGGRKNLLYFKQTTPSDEPKKYPVPEWWGYRPTDPHEEEIKPRAKPAVPDYMVHQPFQGVRDDMDLNSRGRSRVPFGQDGQSYWLRDANNVKQPHKNIVIQKRKRMLEPIQAIYRDVALEKPAGVSLRSRSQSAKEPNSNRGSEFGVAFIPELPDRMKTFIASREDEPAILSKILNYGYQKEWLDEREEQRKMDEEKRRLFSQNLKKSLSAKGYTIVDQHSRSAVIESETLDAGMMKPASGTQMSAAKRYEPSMKGTGAQTKPWKTTSKTAHHGPPTEANLYKMKRFEKIPSRLHANSSIPMQEVQ